MAQQFQQQPGEPRGILLLSNRTQSNKRESGPFPWERSASVTRRLFHRHHREDALRHGKADVLSAEGHAIDPLGIGLVGGTRVLGQHPLEGLPVLQGNGSQEFWRKVHLQPVPLVPVGEAPGRFRVGIGVGEVGFQVQDGGAVQEIGPQHMDHRPQFRVLLHTVNLHAGKADGVGTEGGPGGKHPHAGVPAQPRRADRGGPGVPNRLGKHPHHPEVGEPLQPPQGVWIPVFWLKYDGGTQGVHQPALSGDAELGGKGAVHGGDDVHGEGILHRNTS